MIALMLTLGTAMMVLMTRAFFIRQVSLLEASSKNIEAASAIQSPKQYHQRHTVINGNAMIACAAISANANPSYKNHTECFSKEKRKDLNLPISKNNSLVLMKRMIGYR